MSSLSNLICLASRDSLDTGLVIFAFFYMCFFVTVNLLRLSYSSAFETGRKYLVTKPVLFFDRALGTGQPRR